MQFTRRVNGANYSEQPQARTYSFQSSSVTYGGVNGAYYTSSTTRRSGSDGVGHWYYLKSEIIILFLNPLVRAKTGTSKSQANSQKKKLIVPIECDIFLVL